MMTPNPKENVCGHPWLSVGFTSPAVGYLEQ